jgi:putative peptidoglycan lipid II flippase
MQKGWMLYLVKILLATGLMAGAMIFLIPSPSWWQQAVALDKVLWLLGLILLALTSFFASLYVLRLNVRQLLRH